MVSGLTFLSLICFEFTLYMVIENVLVLFLLCCSKYIILIMYQFSRSVVSDSLRSHESQHARPPCPAPTPGVHSD